MPVLASSDWNAIISQNNRLHMIRCIFSLSPLQFTSQGASTTADGCLRPDCWALPQFHSPIPTLPTFSRARGERGAAPSASYSCQIKWLVFGWISSLTQLSRTSPSARQGGRGCNKGKGNCSGQLGSGCQESVLLLLSKGELQTSEKTMLSLDETSRDEWIVMAWPPVWKKPTV